ncbi:MAG: hypothetical protein J6G98_04915 [Bacilli bacterium]|nr:hypothetical protein [Bacilli bacterium]
MIDIHTHIIYDVDDGSKSLEQSIKYLKQAKKIGVNKVVCTPHMSHDKKEKALKIVDHFKILREEAQKLGVELYLGNEIMYSDNTVKLLKTRKIISLNNSKYVLVEFKRNENRNFDNIVSSLCDLADNGYYPILAHPEFYINYRNIDNYRILKENGVLLQLDSTSLILNKTSLKTYKFAKKLIKERLIDFVATDSHCTKKRDYLSLKKAYKKVSKIDKKYADIIFNDNQLDIIGEI